MGPLMGAYPTLFQPAGIPASADPFLSASAQDDQDDSGDDDANSMMLPASGRQDTCAVISRLLPRSRLPRTRRTSMVLFALWAREDLSGVLEAHIERLKARVRNDAGKPQLTFAPTGAGGSAGDAGDAASAGAAPLVSASPPFAPVEPSAQVAALAAPPAVHVPAPRTRHRTGGMSMDFSAGAHAGLDSPPPVHAAFVAAAARVSSAGSEHGDSVDQGHDDGTAAAAGSANVSDADADVDSDALFVPRAAVVAARSVTRPPQLPGSGGDAGSKGYQQFLSPTVEAEADHGGDGYGRADEGEY